MATGSDVREIFQLAKPSEHTVRVRKVEKKPDGISRELYGLIGNNVSTVAFNNPTYKPKLNLSTKAVNWTWRPFVNPSREDDLILHHWQKTRTDPNEEYRFHKFNKAIDLQEFTKDEYKSHLQDPDWTYEETEYLWDLCRRFDLRWVVIQDRYEWPPQEHDLMALKYHAQIVVGNKNVPTTITTTTEGESSDPNASSQQQINSSQPSATPLALSAPTPTAPTSLSSESKEMVIVKPSKPRSMEDLKHRYYSVTRTLIRSRTTLDSSQAVEKAQMLTTLMYDKDRETERKKNLEILNTRTPEQIEEEEALYLEARRIEQNEKKITKERENLLRLLNTRDIYGPGGPASAGLASPGSLVAGGGGPGTGIIIPSNSITIPTSSPTNGPMSPSVKGANGAVAAPPAAKKRKKAPKGSTQAEEAPASASSSQKGSSSNRRPSNASTTDSTTIVQNLPQGVQIKKEKLIPGAYMRSQKMAAVVSTKQQRVQATLTQLGLPLKPAMPTATVMTKWDQLTNNIVSLLDLKKQVDKLESDLKVAKIRRGSASGSGLFPGGGSGSASLGSNGASSSSSLGGDSSGFGIKREGTADETGTPGQVKKKKRKE
ncbi:swr complex subunit [Podila minutissima]|uniref:SWR1-complex protein 4 n=1 Tax=Podila minutissima TaxID=64525 RepID=A0A9P5SQF9_9FUNG|nr:swr complex subunit [Podila minutissima]